jgi:alkanesulfonate monooxygenase SsuD/methylene tetrahydromethanopterin reductase-like flavin-dependent oxidoreductase (luciferase family)
MRYAVAVPNFGEFAVPERVIALARLANQRGWDGFFLWDHALWLPPFELEVLIHGCCSPQSRRPRRRDRKGPIGLSCG